MVELFEGDGAADLAVADRGAVLEIRDLEVTFQTEDGIVQAVRGIDLWVREREVLGIVGESGSGKSVTMLAALGLLPKTATVKGSVKFRGEELIGQKDKAVRRYRARFGAMRQVHTVLICGSSASRKPSPRKFNEKSVNAIVTPGKISCHGKTAMF